MSNLIWWLTKKLASRQLRQFERQAYERGRDSATAYWCGELSGYSRGYFDGSRELKSDENALAALQAGIDQVPRS